MPEPGTSAARALTIGLVLNSLFVVVEIGAGIGAKSTALLADALHNLGDVGGLALALGAAWLARRAATAKRTYGFRRSTLLAGLANAALIFASVGVVLWEAVHHLRQPPAVNGKLVMAVAAAGVVVNGLSALLLLRSQGSEKDVNVRGAFVHLAGDAAISAGVVVSGLIIAYTGWSLVDPITSILISLVVLVATWRLLRDSLDLVLDAVPNDLATSDVTATLKGETGVIAVHDLHIWATSSTQTALTAHLVVDDGAAPDLVLRLSRGLEEKFGISHVTLQVEREGLSEAHCAQGDGCLG